MMHYHNGKKKIHVQKNPLRFTALEPFNMFRFASSIAAWIQDSTHALVNSDLAGYYGHELQCWALVTEAFHSQLH